MRAGQEALRLFGNTGDDDPQSAGYMFADRLRDVEARQLQGMAMVPQLLNLEGTEIQAAGAFTNLLSAYRTPLTNPAALQQNTMSMVTGQMVNPNALMQTSAQVSTSNLNAAANVAMANQQTASDRAVSLLNFGAEVYGADRMLEGARLQADAQTFKGFHANQRAHARGYAQAMRDQQS